ncbi:hypothetical protein [Roseivivax isoporae]|uniref:Uncharacterized protein n=1 Tax=Roseivivax isoporae LMG 25204 TaxID=1449351 RepID=X7FBL6_9RHOB|nr:hypothetical protein [Roseivivax isoporae]ETX29496.1 hypothetical protein RISW2_23455 [Roseivivax isoporae LMG 25204]
MSLRLALVCTAFLALPGLAAAETCLARVNHQDVVVDTEAVAADGAGLRERMRAWPSRTWKRAWGAPPACDSRTLIAYLGREVPAEDLDGYCLADDPSGGGDLLVPGVRNYRGRCTVTTCDRVNAAAGGTAAAAGRVVDVVTRRDVEAGQSRTGAVLHASGAAILSGTASGIAGTLSGAASSVATALAAPAVAGAAAVSVVAIGGAVYLCHDGEEDAADPAADIPLGQGGTAPRD